jgi:hypothetical protein
LSEARERFYQQFEARGEHPQQHHKDRLRDAAVYIRQIDDLNAELVKALASLIDAPLRYNDNRVEIDCADHSDAMARVRSARAVLKKARGA